MIKYYYNKKQTGGNANAIRSQNTSITRTRNQQTKPSRGVEKRAPLGARIGLNGNQHNARRQQSQTDKNGRVLRQTDKIFRKKLKNTLKTVDKYKIIVYNNSTI